MDKLYFVTVQDSRSGQEVDIPNVTATNPATIAAKAVEKVYGYKIKLRPYTDELQMKKVSYRVLVRVSLLGGSRESENYYIG